MMVWLNYKLIKPRKQYDEWICEFQNGDEREISINISNKAEYKVTKWLKVNKVR